MFHFTRRAIVQWTAAMLLALVVVYPLSYAPVVRNQLAHASPDRDFFAPDFDGAVMPIYRPVD